MAQMITTAATYRKLEKVFTGTAKECRQIIADAMPFARKDIKENTRGNNLIAYYRPDGGKTINDKVWMLHWNNDGTVSLYL
jgi:hypothetical protein